MTLDTRLQQRTADLQRAKQYLHTKNPGLDIDAFLADRTKRWERFFTQPVGPTAECLTGAAVKTIAEQPIIGRVTQPRKAYHLRQCTDCQSAYTQYSQDEFYFMN